VRIQLWLAILAAPLFGQTLQLTQGAADYQVYQRGPANAATIQVSGAAANAAGKNVEARLVAAGRALNGFDWKAAGRVTASKWAAELKDVPTGGPYRLELRVAGATAVTSVSNLLVGDLWILAGQSNMEGVGRLNTIPLPLPSAVVNSLDMTDQWVTAQDPLHRLVDSVDSVQWGKNAAGQVAKLEGEELRAWIAKRYRGAGVGLPFALEMVKRTGVPVGLIPCAHGGTSMNQWSPELKEKGSASLYGAMLRRFQLAGGKVRGILWYQGESDASVVNAPLFEEKFVKFIQAVRADFNQPDLPFYYVQIGRVVSVDDPAPWNAVQNSQLKAETRLPNVWMTDCADCEMDDGIHVGTDYQLVLGRRLALLAEGKTKRGPRPVAARLQDNVISVEFAEVNGGLTYEGRLTGFIVVDAKGAPSPNVYRARVSASNPNVVELLVNGKIPEGAAVQHGYGRNPYVNLHDQAGQPVPVFGPLPLAVK
jgi:sialate O-acetylesterase